MPSIHRVTIRTLHKDGRLTQTLGIYLTTHVVQSNPSSDQFATLFALVRAIHVGQHAETKALRTRRIHKAVHVHVRL